MSASDQPRGVTSAPPESERSLAQLMGELTDETRTLFRQEFELARAEVKQDATRAARAGGKLGAAGATGFLAWLLLAFAIAWGIGEATDVWIGFAIVGIVHAVAAGVLAVAGRNQMQDVSLAPDRAIEEAKETKQWMQDRA